MPEIGFHQFNSIALLNEAVAALLKYHLEQEYPFAHAVMLSGGSTPLEAYRLLASRKCIVSEKLHIFLSDERLVPITSPLSNFGNMRTMLDSLGLDQNQLIRVDTDLEPLSSAARYDVEIRRFINNGGRVTLGLLGLGDDGHTASLFCREDLERGKGRYTIPVVAPDGMKRVSVTVDLLSKIQQVVFVVAGNGKKAIVDELVNNPSRVPAGIAVAGVKRKQIWFAA